MSRIKRMLLLMLLGLAPTYSFAADTGPSTEPSHTGLALVLSGGGARGLAQIGVLRVLDSLGIRPDIIVATSMGSIVGSLYACGWSAREIDSIARKIDWDNALSNSARRPDQLVSQKREPSNTLFELRFGPGFKPILPNAISNGQTIYEVLCPLTAGSAARAQGNFDSLPIPLRIVTTDILTGDCVVFTKGDIADIVRASCAIPLALSPIAMDDRILVDGGLTANIPIEPALALGNYAVVAVDVTSPLWNKDQLDNPVHMIDQVIAINIDRQKKSQRDRADLLITPELIGMRNTDFRNIDTLIARGRNAALAALPRLLEICAAPKPDTINVPMTSSIRFADSTIPLRLADTVRSLTKKLPVSRAKVIAASVLRQAGIEPFSITSDDSGNIHIGSASIKNVAVSGNTHTSLRHVLAASDIEKGDLFNSSHIRRTLQAAYATGLFETVAVGADALGRVNVTVREKNYLRLRIGLRLDEYNGLEGYLEPAHENVLGTGTVGLLHLQYGPTRQKYALEFSTSQPWNLWWANTVGLQAYLSSESLSKREIITDTSGAASDRIEYDEVTIRKTGLLASLGTPIGRVFMIDGGFRIENFNVAKADHSRYTDPIDGAYRDGMSSFILRLNFDNLDRWPYPRKGQKDYISLGGASALTDNSNRFVHLHLNFEEYGTFLSAHTLGIMAFAAVADRHLPPVAQIYLGGHPPADRFSELTVYVRKPFSGLKPNAIPCDAALLLRGQYRISPAKNIHITSNIDWGYGWQQNSITPGSFSFSKAVAKSFIQNALVGIGLEAAVQTLVGPISLGCGKVVAGSLTSRYNILNPGCVFYLSAGHDF